MTIKMKIKQFMNEDLKFNDNFSIQDVIPLFNNKNDIVYKNTNTTKHIKNIRLNHILKH